MHALDGHTAASLSEMSLFTVCLIAYAPPNDNDPAGIHWRLLLLDINFTQMCPQWAQVHERMNAHGHTYTVTKPQFEPLARDFIIAPTVLPLPLRWWLIRE